MTGGAQDGTPAPVDPLTAMTEGAASAHEIYLSYVHAGFSEAQALYLTGQVLTAAMRRHTEPPDA